MVAASRNGPSGQRLQLHARPVAGNRPVSSVAIVLPGGGREVRRNALTTRLGFGFEHFQQHRQRVVVPGMRQLRHDLLGRRRRAEREASPRPAAR